MTEYSPFLVDKFLANFLHTYPFTTKQFNRNYAFLSQWHSDNFVKKQITSVYNTYHDAQINTRCTGGYLRDVNF